MAGDQALAGCEKFPLAPTTFEVELLPETTSLKAPLALFRRFMTIGLVGTDLVEEAEGEVVPLVLGGGVTAVNPMPPLDESKLFLIPLDGEGAVSLSISSTGSWIL